MERTVETKCHLREYSNKLWWIYRNRLLLDHECPPSDFPFRKDEIDIITGLINPILTDNKPSNGIIYGSYSTGKTTAIKKILEYLETRSKVVPVYINCELTASKREVYKKIIKKAKGVDINQNRIVLMIFILVLVIILKIVKKI